MFGFPDNLGLISKEAKTLPEYFQNKMILLIGDSFERRLLEYICKRADGISTKAMLNGAIFSKYIPGGGDPNICVIRKKSKILVLINIFNFGVRIARNPAMGINSHWTPDLSPFDTKERVTLIPHFLLSIANHTFPELCNDNHICPLSSNITRLDQVKIWNASNRFWFPPPDLVVAQSGLWDLQQRNTDDKNATRFVNEWTELLTSKLLQPLKNSLGQSVRDCKTNQKQQQQWFTRTIPYISAKNEFPDSFVDKMNTKLREERFLNRADQDYGLLDWAALVGNHHDWLIEDGFHMKLYAAVLFTSCFVAKIYAVSGNSSSVNIPLPNTQTNDTLLGLSPIEIVPSSRSIFDGQSHTKVTYLDHSLVTGNVTFAHVDPSQEFLYLDNAVPGFLTAVCTPTTVTIRTKNATLTLNQIFVGSHILISMDYTSCQQIEKVNENLKSLLGYRVVQNITTKGNGIVLLTTTTESLLSSINISIAIESTQLQLHNNELSRRAINESSSSDFSLSLDLNSGKDFAWTQTFGPGSASEDVDLSLKTTLAVHTYWAVFINIGLNFTNYAFQVGANSTLTLVPTLAVTGTVAVSVDIHRYTPVAPIFSILGVVSAGIYGAIDFEIGIQVSGTAQVGIPITLTQAPWLYTYSNGQGTHTADGTGTYEIDLNYTISGSVVPSVSVTPGVGIGISVAGVLVAGVEVGFTNVIADTLTATIPAVNTCYLTNSVTYEGLITLSAIAGLPTVSDSVLVYDKLGSWPVIPTKILNEECLVPATNTSATQLSGYLVLSKGKLISFVLLSAAVVAKKKCVPQTPTSSVVYAAASATPIVIPVSNISTNSTLLGQDPVPIAPSSNSEYVGQTTVKVTYLDHELMTGNVTFSHANNTQSFLYIDDAVPSFVNAICNSTSVSIETSNVTDTLAQLSVGDHLLISMDYPSCSQTTDVNGTTTTLPGYRIIQAVLNEGNGTLVLETTDDYVLSKIHIDITMASKPISILDRGNSTLNRRISVTKGNSYDFPLNYDLKSNSNFSWTQNFGPLNAVEGSTVDLDLDAKLDVQAEWAVTISIKWFTVSYSFNVGGGATMSIEPSMNLTGTVGVTADIHKYTPVAPVFTVLGIASVGIYGAIEFLLDLQINGDLSVSLPVTVTQSPWKYTYTNGKGSYTGSNVTYEIDLDYSFSGSVVPTIAITPGVGIGISAFGSLVAGVEVGFTNKFVDTLATAVPAVNGCFASNNVTYEGILTVDAIAGFPTGVDATVMYVNLGQWPLVPTKVLDQRCILTESVTESAKITGSLVLAKGSF
ncbi:hypothetical protein HK100_008110 [Physocladia obscura]|uniref:Uncharacterized protein n=1 Tax=Physocladia obscura TaxID=109957 RepID=A0AAD5T9B3_9FUNG|nr:hypothetical protein HK100_008110 [Physocladia obscura]